MAKNTLITDKQRDEILTQSVIYRKTPKEIAAAIGLSYDTVRRTVMAYEMVKGHDWEKLTAKANTRDISDDYIRWAEHATQTKVPQDVMDIAFPKPKSVISAEPPKAEVKTSPETSEKILAVLQAIEADLPQILTALTYLSKTFKEVVNANADPMMQMLKTANENLVGIKCNTRKLNGER